MLTPLASIAASAESIQTLCGTAFARAPSPHTCALPPPLTGPTVPDLRLDLIDEGLLPKAAEYLNHVFRDSILRTARVCQREYTTACERVLALGSGDLALDERLGRALVSRVTQAVEKAHQPIFDTVTTVRDLLDEHGDSDRQPFDGSAALDDSQPDLWSLTSSVPSSSSSFSGSSDTPDSDKFCCYQAAMLFFKECFEVNCHPEKGDRVLLASLADMDVKQVRVWFQNQRNRKGKTRKRTTPSSYVPKPAAQRRRTATNNSSSAAAAPISEQPAASPAASIPETLPGSPPDAKPDFAMLEREDIFAAAGRAPLAERDVNIDARLRSSEEGKKTSEGAWGAPAQAKGGDEAMQSDSPTNLTSHLPGSELPSNVFSHFKFDFTFPSSITSAYPATNALTVDFTAPSSVDQSIEEYVAGSYIPKDVARDAYTREVVGSTTAQWSQAVAAGAGALGAWNAAWNDLGEQDKNDCSHPSADSYPTPPPDPTSYLPPTSTSSPLPCTPAACPTAPAPTYSNWAPHLSDADHHPPLSHTLPRSARRTSDQEDSALAGLVALRSSASAGFAYHLNGISLALPPDSPIKADATAGAEHLTLPVELNPEFLRAAAGSYAPMWEAHPQTWTAQH